MTAATERLTKRFGGHTGVWLLSTLLIALAGAFLLVIHGSEPLVSETAVRWWMLIPVFLLVEIFVVHIDSQREAQTISLSEVAIVGGLFLVSPAGLVAAQAIGSGLALMFYRRQSAVKIAFNIAQFAVGTSTAIAIFRFLVGDLDAASPIAWGVAALALLVADFATALLLSLVIRIVDGKRATPTIRYFIGFGTICTLANTALGLLGVSLLVSNPQAGLLLVVPIAVTVAAYRGYWREHRRNETLEFLYETMRRLGAEEDIDRGVRDLLDDARSVFHANIAALIVHPADATEAPRRALVGPADAHEPLTDVEPIGTSLTLSAEPSIAPFRSAGPYWCPVLGRHVRDAMVISLEGKGRTVGTLIVADRASSINTFTRSDLQFLRTFAGHAGAVLENRNLARENDELAQRASLDPLTQLANRSLFHERVDEALEGEGGPFVGVLYIDLDDFKGVNDTFGHATGDQVLIAVSERLRSCLRPGDVASRLGGDEFAVLLADLSDSAEADRVCERILGALLPPVIVGEASIAVRASVGASVHAVGTPAETIIDQADSAMYDAKRAGKARWMAHPETSGTRE